MSAYVLDHEEINLIVTWLTGIRSWHVYGRRLEEFLGYEPNNNYNRERLGETLLAMNRDAVQQRYPNDPPDRLPGPINPGPYGYSHVHAGMFKTYERLGSLMYQCSEGDVPQSELYKLMNDIYNHMAHRIARAVIDGEYELPEALRGEA